MTSLPRARLTGPALVIAPRLLGAVLTASTSDGDVAVRITEVEAYEGSEDPASHAFRGLTQRTAVMFGPAGRLYCYFTYGMHWCANVVCGTEGVAAAVLLRAGEVVEGLDLARARRETSRRDIDLARGPARLARVLALGAEHNGIDLLDPLASLALRGVRSRRPTGLRSGPRVGISVAAQRPWRFWLPDEPTVSAYKAGGRNRRAVPRQTDGS